MSDEPWTRWRVVAVAGPLALALFQTVGTFGAARGQTGRHDIDALAVFLVVAGPLSLLAVRRHPLPVLWFVSAVTLAYLLREYPYGPVFASLAVVVVVAVVLGHRYAAWAAIAAVVAGHFALRAWVLDAPWSWGQVLGVGAWALLILVVAEFVRVRRERTVTARRARAETARREANEERLRIARELHDVVAHHISLINVQAGVALHLVDRKPEQTQTALAAIKDASREALTELRSLVGVLRDEAEGAPRDPAATLRSLDDLIERSGYAGLTVRKRVEGRERPLPSAVELAAFRIIQEAITNVVRHAAADTATVTLDYREEELVVTIEDDGRGTRGAAEAAVGSGIRGMRERASALGGTLDVSDVPGTGARVRAALPLGGDR
ncbi:MAG: sensor histidine kinase [Nocardioidaceae bacterium]